MKENLTAERWILKYGRQIKRDVVKVEGKDAADQLERLIKELELCEKMSSLVNTRHLFVVAVSNNQLLSVKVLENYISKALKRFAASDTITEWFSNLDVSPKFRVSRVPVEEWREEQPIMAIVKQIKYASDQISLLPEEITP